MYRSSTRNSDQVNGVMLRIAAAGLIVAMSACVKVAAQQVELSQVIFWRSLLSLIPIVLYLVIRSDFPKGIKTKHPMAHLKRSVLGFVTMVCSFVSFKYLPLATATAISFLVPLASLPLAAMILGERITRLLLVSVLVGLAGIFIMLLPDLTAPELSTNVLIGMAGGLGFVVSMSFLRVFIKSMTETESASSIAFYFGVTCAAIAALAWPFGWTMPDADIWVYLVAAGILGGIGHIAATEAIAMAPVSLLGPFEYTGLLWAMVLDIALFGLFPNVLATTGAVVIIIGALLATRVRVS
ncbi:MAG: DMT family transporter [Aliishimia sp.]